MTSKADDFHIPSAAEMRHNLRERIGDQETQLARVTRQRDAAVEALRQFAENKLSDANCDSVETASRRIANLARRALKQIETQ